MEFLRPVSFGVDLNFGSWRAKYRANIGFIFSTVNIVFNKSNFIQKL